MTRQPDWTPDEDKFLLSHGPHQLLHRTHRACDTRLYKLRKREKVAQKSGMNAGLPLPRTLVDVLCGPGIDFKGKFPKFEEQPPTFAEDRTERGNEHWERQHRELSKKYNEALKALSLVDRLVEGARDMAPVSYQAAPPVIPPKVRHSDSTPQSAVLHFSDSHVGLVVRPTQTSGFGGYNFSTFLDRLAYLEDSIRSIVTNHTNTPLDELVIVWGGDMVNGSLEHAAEAGQENTVFAQVFGCAHALGQFVRNIASNFLTVRCFGVAGNHGRWANQKKMPTSNRYSNLDSFVYAMVEALTRDVQNIQWTLDEQPVADFQVQEHRFLCLHGDVWKGGDRALGLPAHAIGRQLSASAQLYAKAGLVPPAYILSGHLHRQFEIPTSSGAVLINGGWPGVDTYSLAAAFTPVDPSQRFFFVHPKFKITAAYSLSLAYAKTSAGDRYIIPSGISIE